MTNNRFKAALSLILILAIAASMLSSCFLFQKEQSFDLANIPAFSGSPYVIIDDNKPSFTDDEITTRAYEHYSELDLLGRCGMVEACCGKELMPAKDEDRGSISSVTPSGWVQAQYSFVDGTYLYNRCHLIGWQLTAENANEKNLIAGTRYLNIEGMLPFENMIADYIKETGNHVMYRVTPIYKGNDLLPSGVHMEGYSVEDNGKGISFNVYCYNVQPGVRIDYKTGDAKSKSNDNNFYVGKNIQLYLYMNAFAIDGDKPAGAYYYAVNNNFINEDESPSILHGKTLDDEEIISASDDDFYSGKTDKSSVCEIKRKTTKASGTYYDGNLADDQTIKGYMKYSKLMVEQAIDNVLDGVIIASPYVSSCDYCEFGGICGREIHKKSDYRSIKGVKAETILNAVEHAENKDGGEEDGN